MRKHFLTFSLAFLLLTGDQSAVQSPAPRLSPEVLTVNYCNLVGDISSYNQKQVRVRAIYRNGFEASFLHDPACRGKGGTDHKVWVKYVDSFDSASKPETLKKFYELLNAPIPSRPDGSIDISETREFEVVFVGKFEVAEAGEGFGHQLGFDYQLTVESVEEVRAIARDSSK